MAEGESKANTALYQKFLKIQAEVQAPKNQYNEFGGYSYRSCEDILGAVKPMLAAAGLVLRLSDEVVQVGDRYYIRAEAMITDGKDCITAKAYARESDSRPKMDAAQLTGSASSYARKYALNGLFCIDDMKDADSMKPAEEPKKKAAKASTKEDYLRRVAAEAKKQNVTNEEIKAIMRSRFQKSTSAELTDDEAKNFAESDRLRDELTKLGYAVKDIPGGAWELKKL